MSKAARPHINPPETFLFFACWGSELTRKTFKTHLERSKTAIYYKQKKWFKLKFLLVGKAKVSFEKHRIH